MSWGMVGAIVAALAYGASTILQAIGVRRIADAPEGSGWVDRARAGWLYGVGLGLDAVGFLASFAALRTLPLFLVESVLAASVAVTAGLAVWFLGLRLARREVLALLVIGVGLVLLAVSAEEGHARQVGHRGGLLLVGLALVVAAIFAVGYLDKRASRSSIVLATASGLGFGVVGIASRVLQIPDAWWRVVLEPTLWALAIAGGLAVIAYAFALERGRTTSVAAITFATETILPATVGLLLLGDRVRDHFAVAASIGFVITLGGCIALAARAEPEVTRA
ncbi:hypothetical protein [Yimella sp. cx-51]|uniref:hypothetical protein n=1 Tax=Yimella sp. cx-51 TaxID=2770551 RepID=UPI00165E8683|nr:hypothetical protein [Yimella sp. cx-51]MBC9957033.1 hypothetical protein [Yimella sp. cx-51]QTH37301.1 hypothetical protein J5M86_10445 [Yimella sp. cx-51]